MPQFAELQEKLTSYFSTEQIQQVHDAYNLAEQAHKGQVRVDGTPFITHPLEVAKILADMHMDCPCIVAAILHDTIEDTVIEKEQVHGQFGEVIADLVDGVSKLDQIKFENKAEAQAENFRRMILAMSKDMRVIIIKLADRLHNMRTLDAMSLEQRKRKARETLDIYAPIANRLGMHNFRIELEDLGFAHLYPVRYQVLKVEAKKSMQARKEITNNLAEILEESFKEKDLDVAKIISREKHLYSLYKKMRVRNLPFIEVMDVYGLRVCVDTVDECYRALGIIHGVYNPAYGRFKDYIAVPKPNNYQSLHTTVIGPKGVAVEIQIRTYDMDEFAEDGIAAHWTYKSSGKKHSDVHVSAAKRVRRWVQEMVELQEHAKDPMEFIEHAKVDLYQDAVYVFTPAGEVLSLPRGATVVDYAYAVHTDIGNSCIAAKIDRRLEPLSTRLSNGQTVEIVTAKGANPNPVWLSFVMTGKARSSIRHWLRSQHITEARELGRKLVARSLLALSKTIDDIAPEKFLEVAKELNLGDEKHLFEEMGLGNHVAPLVARRLLEELEDLPDMVKLEPLAIKSTEGMVISYGKCCYPVPGDSIIGFLSAGRGMVIHRESCGNVTNIHGHPEQYIFAQWEDNIEKEFSVAVRVDVVDDRGVLAVIANALTSLDANIENLNVDERDDKHNILKFIIHVRDKVHLAKILRKMKSIKCVLKVTRV